MLGGSAIGELALGEHQAQRSAFVAAALGTIFITGNDVGLYVGHVLSADTGAFSISEGGVVDFSSGRIGLSMSSSGGARGLRAHAGGRGQGLRVRA